jgi:hypothetical protein
LAVTQQPILAVVAVAVAVKQLAAQVDLESLFLGTPTLLQSHFHQMRLVQRSEQQYLVTQSLKVVVL